jgi:hypothetical protein
MKSAPLVFLYLVSLNTLAQKFDTTRIIAKALYENRYRFDTITNVASNTRNEVRRYLSVETGNGVFKKVFKETVENDSLDILFLSNAYFFSFNIPRFFTIKKCSDEGNSINFEFHIEDLRGNVYGVGEMEFYRNKDRQVLFKDMKFKRKLIKFKKN